MAEFLQDLAASPWVLVVVFAVAGLDAVLPLSPSESTVVAVGVAAAATGRPSPALLVVAAATGAFAGDQVAYRLGRRAHRAVTARLTRGRRGRWAHLWVDRMMHQRGGLLIVFARYLPGGRSTAAVTAGVVGYPAARFHWYTCWP